MSELRWSAIAMLSLVFAQQLVFAEAPETKGEQINVFDKATLAVPAAFKRVEVKSRIIEHEFEAGTGEGDEKKVARVTMMAAGGDVKSNIDRWKGQFIGGDDEPKTEEMKAGDWTIHLVDVSGRYQERTGGGPFAGGKIVERDGYAMTGAILQHSEGGKYFVKMIGPKEAVKANREGFVEMIKGINN